MRLTYILTEEIPYLRGYASTLWPRVTKLVSWLDIKEAREETLEKCTKMKA